MAPAEAISTPELDKSRAIFDSGQALLVQDFIDWLGTQNLTIAEEDPWNCRYFPHSRSSEQLMADFFGIDRDKIEQERRALLDEVREDLRKAREGKD